MQRILACLLLGCLPSFGWDVGFDFRATQSYVTDPSYAIFASNVNYPTTLGVNGQSVTFGWETQSASFVVRDRSVSGDPRLAGVSCQANDGAISVFRVDLPSAGTYRIGVAAGRCVRLFAIESRSRSATPAPMSFPLMRLRTPIASRMRRGSLGPVSVWPGSNMSVQRAFGTTILRLTLGGAVDSAYSCLAHLRVTSVQGGAPGASRHGCLLYFKESNVMLESVFESYTWPVADLPRICGTVSRADPGRYQRCSYRPEPARLAGMESGVPIKRLGGVQRGKRQHMGHERCGCNGRIDPSNTLRFIDKRDNTSPSVCDLPLTGYSNVLVRLATGSCGNAIDLRTVEL